MKTKKIFSLILIIGTSFPIDAQKGFSIKGKEITLNFDFYKDKSLRLRTILPASYNRSIKLDPLEADNDAEIFLHITGENRNTHHGAKLTGASASGRLEFIEKTEYNTPEGKIITLVQHDPVKNLKVESFYEFNNFSPVIRRYAMVTNEGSEDVGIEYISSAILNNFGNLTNGNTE